MDHNIKSGAQYLSSGFKLVWKPGIKRFVFIPLLINLVVLSIATIYAFNLISDWHASLPLWLDSQINSEHWYIRWPSEVLSWVIESLDWLLWPLLVASVLISVFFVFSFLANWIAAPFNGLLAEAVEKHLASDSYAETDFRIAQFLSDIPRLVGREWQKFIYYLPRAVGCLILFFTPLSVLAPFIWFLFNSWMSAIQYVDYPIDNNQMRFSTTLSFARQNKKDAYSFGIVVMLITMIPIINLLLMPVAVAGGVHFWFDRNQLAR